MRQLENGVKEVFNSERFLEYLKFMSSFYNYSFRNVLLIHMQNPNATMVAGYNDWKNKHNRQVLKGEKGLRILAPVPYKIKVDKPIFDEHGNPVVIDGKQITESVEVNKLRFKPVSVFDVSQTEGESIPQLAPELNFQVKNYPELFAAISAVSNYPITFENIPGRAHGYCDYNNQKIVIDTGMSEAQNIKTAIHEVAHSRLHSPENNQNQRTKRTVAEVEAESVAYVVSNYFGIDTSDYSFDYIADWSSSFELKELSASLDRIQKEANILIQGIEEQYKILLQNRDVEINNAEKGVDRDMDGIEDSKDSSYSDIKLSPDINAKDGNQSILISNAQARLIQEYFNIPMYIYGDEGAYRIIENFNVIDNPDLRSKTLPTFLFGFVDSNTPVEISKNDWDNIKQYFLEPHVFIEWSESDKVPEKKLLSLAEANALFESADLATVEEYAGRGGYDKTKYALFYAEGNTAKIIVDRQDFGDGDGSLIDHIRLFNPHLANVLDVHALISQLNGVPNIKKTELLANREKLNAQPQSLESLINIRQDLLDITKAAQVSTHTATIAEQSKDTNSVEQSTLDRLKAFVSEHKEQIAHTLNEHKTVVINAFAGPGAGKTTSCLEVCEKLKKAGYVAEYVQEYAKELVWDNNLELLNGSTENQFTILQEQLKRIDRLYGKVDFIVTDSPVLLNTEYLNGSNTEYSSAVQNLYGHFNNFNYFVERDVATFESEGRIHNLKQSLEIDSHLKNDLQAMNIEFGTYTHSTIDDIVHNAIDYKLHSDYPLNNDLVRQANAATLIDMGDIMLSEYNRNLDLISQLNISNKNEAYQTLQGLYNQQLSAQAKAVNPYVSGVAKLSSEQAKKTYTELTAKTNGNIKSFIHSLQSQSNKNNLDDKHRRIQAAISEADKKGLKSVTVEGTTYYKGRKNWSTKATRSSQKSQTKSQQYSKEENDRIVKEIKSSIPIQDYAQAIGFTVKRAGSYYTLKEHDSVRIDPRKNAFWRNSQGSKAQGSIIDFVMHFEGLDQATAINKLASYIGANGQTTQHNLPKAPPIPSQEKKSTEFVLPQKGDKTMRNVYAYLIHTRKIDSEIVKQWVRNGNLYQDVNKNCVFVTYDKSGKPNFASQKGTNTSKPFQADVENSDYNCCHFINNNAKTLIVCEAVIDLMSVQTILKANGRDLNNYNYLSLNGAGKTHAILNALQNCKTDTVVLATDNDTAGAQARAELRELSGNFDKDIKFVDFIPKSKNDWNAELIANVQRETSAISQSKKSLSDKISECQNKANAQNKSIEINKQQNISQKRNSPDLS